MKHKNLSILVTLLITLCACTQDYQTLTDFRISNKQESASVTLKFYNIDISPNLPPIDTIVILEPHDVFTYSHTATGGNIPSQLPLGTECDSVVFIFTDQSKATHINPFKYGECNVTHSIFSNENYKTQKRSDGWFIYTFGITGSTLICE